MALVTVGRHLGAALLEHRAVTKGAVADAEARLDLLRRADHGLAVAQREDLAAACVDHGHRARRAGGERVQGRDTRHLQVERERQATRGGEPESQAGEAAGAGPDRERGQVARSAAGLAQQLVGVLEHRDGAGDALTEHSPVLDERRSGDPRRRVKRESQHPRKGL